MKAEEIQRKLDENQIDEFEACQLALDALINLESKLKERDFSLNVNDPYQFVLTDKKGNTYSFNPQKKWGEELNDFLVGNVNIKN